MITSKPEALIFAAWETTMRAKSESIQEVFIALSFPLVSDHRQMMRVWSGVACIMNATTHFKNLTHLKLQSDTKVYFTESALAEMILHLDRLESVALCSHEGFLKDDDPEGVYDLGKALAALNQLQYLSLRGLRSPDPHWLLLQWKAPLVELSIVRCRNLRDVSLLKFAHKFHSALVNLSMECGQMELTPAEKASTQNFNHLNQVTITQDIVSTGFFFVFSSYPSIKSIAWVLPLDDTEEWISPELGELVPRGGKWPSLVKVILPIFICFEDSHPARDLFMKFCTENSLMLKFLQFEEHGVYT